MTCVVSSIAGLFQHGFFSDLFVQVLLVILSVGNKMSHLQDGLSTLLLGSFSNIVRVVSLRFFLVNRIGKILGKDFSFSARYEVLMEIQTFWKVNVVAIGKYFIYFLKSLRVLERSVTVYRSTRHNILEDMKLQIFRHVRIIWENSPCIYIYIYIYTYICVYIYIYTFYIYTGKPPT